MSMFGFATAVFDNLVVIGAPGVQDDSGAVYIYQEIDKHWYLIQNLTSPKEIVGAQFGFSVKAFGERILISAPCFKVEEELGAVFLYENDTDHLFRLIHTFESPGEANYGKAIAMDHRYIAISGNTWDTKPGRVEM